MLIDGGFHRGTDTFKALALKVGRRNRTAYVKPRSVRTAWRRADSRIAAREICR